MMVPGLSREEADPTWMEQVCVCVCVSSFK